MPEPVVIIGPATRPAGPVVGPAENSAAPTPEESERPTGPVKREIVLGILRRTAVILVRALWAVWIATLRNRR